MSGFPIVASACPGFSILDFDDECRKSFLSDFFPHANVPMIRTKKKGSTIFRKFNLYSCDIESTEALIGILDKNFNFFSNEALRPSFYTIL